LSSFLDKAFKIVDALDKVELELCDHCHTLLKQAYNEKCQWAQQPASNSDTQDRTAANIEGRVRYD
jgi:hypothetical protein